MKKQEVANVVKGTREMCENKIFVKNERSISFTFPKFQIRMQAAF